MIDESQKPWKTLPSDEKWHSIFHQDYFDPRCAVCLRERDSEHPAEAQKKTDPE